MNPEEDVRITDPPEREPDVPKADGDAGGELAVTSDTPALIPADPFVSKRQVVSFLQVDSGARIRQLGLAINDCAANWLDYVGKCVSVVGLTVFTRRVSVDGEIPERWGVYLALHLADGKNVVTAGDGPMADLPLLKASYGYPPWPKGVAVTCHKTKTSQGRTRYCLLPGNVTDETLTG